MTPNLALAASVAILIAIAALTAASGGPVAAVAFSLPFAAGLVAWRLTTFRKPADPARVLVPYLLTIVCFLVHVCEEYRTGFHVAIERVTGVHSTEAAFLTEVAFGAPVLWIIGAALLFRRNPVGNYLCWAFFVAMVFELTHFVLPFGDGGSFHYFPGMYTAILPATSAAYGISRLLAGWRSAPAGPPS